MRPLRLLLSLSSSLIAATLLLYVLLAPPQHGHVQQQANAPKPGRFKPLLSFTSPGSLFPPSAIISLTDDNSTFFLARPAAFGPTLPTDGLSSPLWVGSGFGDDSLGKGELGCGDTPDWARHEDYRTPGPASHTTENHQAAPREGTMDDDIQSLQEKAEIDGKVVLLKRGQCGFLAKVLWAQRRGAVAVIVGDNVRGGALIRMYAKDDTSNVTIPSIFTSHTTAHLLSSLLPGDAFHHLLSGTSTARPNVSGAEQYSPTNRHSSAQTASWLKWFHPSTANVSLDKSKDSSSRSALHKGLWVTLTPTNVSTSPFFDTLLVLVVSPLVTLTVVYALLLLRSRIRRRRWRAPKSLVERLPVRTYQTTSDSTISATPSATSPTTPLLHHSPAEPSSPTHSHSASDDEGPATSFANRKTPRAREEEKRESGLAEWRRRYGGRQKECVVCLDEYVDGVSQVMSLPCGHEFHADCITPWLVTRRRTCPICKGDVVRSLAQSHLDRLPSPSPTRSTRHLENVDDVQAQAAEMRNDSPSASLPMSISASAPVSRPLVPDDDEDVEANWSDDSSGPRSRSRPTNSIVDLGTSLRDLSSTVSTVIWHGVEAVRNTTVFQRRPTEDIDRDR